jgi:hypothetical protein
MTTLNKDTQFTEYICVDALNFTEKFLDRSWNLNKSFIKVQGFVNDVHKDKKELIVFIDGSAETDETLNKWKSRRVREITHGKKFVPHAWATLLGDMFKKCNIEIHYSVNDCDDTIANYAYHNKCSILSRDRDFYRYYIDDNNHNIYRIYHEIGYDNNNRIIFNERPADERHTKKHVLSKKVGPLLETTDKNPFLINIDERQEYLRGVPTNNVKGRGNPHILFEEFRSAIYYNLGYRESVKEILPYYDDEIKSVKWTNNIVIPTENNEIINTPEQYIKNTGELNENDHYKYKFCIKAVVYELWQCSDLAEDKLLFDILKEKLN